MEFILPATEYWLEDSATHGTVPSGNQIVSAERYWLRAINESIEEHEVRDQEVICDCQRWLETPESQGRLITKLTSSPEYADIWEDLAGTLIGIQQDRVFLLCEHVLQRVLQDQGPCASHDSQGFVNTWRFANRRFVPQPENQAWLRDRISEAAAVSIELVNALWHFYGNPGRYSMLRMEDAEPVRRHLLETLRANISSGESLITRLCPSMSATLYQLVFDPGDEGRPILVDPRSWSWLGSPILQALRSGNVTVAENCASLLSTEGTTEQGGRVNLEALDDFFVNAASEVIDILDGMSATMSQVGRGRARTVVEAARKYSAKHRRG